MGDQHVLAMRAAIEQAEHARGGTGDNPWVGCVITSARGVVVARGHTQGPGEDHAEIVAMREALAAGVALAEVTLYSTLEPCAFHGRTPACARAIVDRGVRRVVTGMLDPNPRVDGVGLTILREAGVEVVHGICEPEITRQLAPWIFRFHPHEPLARARALLRSSKDAPRALADWYGIDGTQLEELLTRARQGE